MTKLNKLITYNVTGDKMKKYIIPIILLILVLIQFNKKEITPQVINYIEDIDKINETCHINTNKLNIDLNIEYLDTINDNKIIIYGNEVSELNNYLDKNYYLENKTLNITLNNQGYIYEIFSVFISKEDDYNHSQLLFKNDDYINHLYYLVNESIYEKINIPNNSKIITIQKSIELNKYLIISARRI